MAKEIKESQNQVDPARKLYLSFIFLGLAGLVTVIGLLFHMMNANRISRFPEPGAQTSSGASSEDRYTYRGSESTLFFPPGLSSNPQLLLIGKREYSSSSEDAEKNGIYLSFYDILEEKERKVKKIAPGGAAGSADLLLRTFVNGDIYFILDGKKVYRVDRVKLDAEEVTGEGVQDWVKDGRGSVHYAMVSGVDSRVVYRDDRHLLILVRGHGAPDAPFQLQSLDVHSGVVKWTAVVGEEQPDKALPLNGGFVVAGRFSTSYIDSTGRVVSEYKIK